MTLGYDDYCVITRMTGEIDENGFPEMAQIHAGECDYQHGAVNNWVVKTSTDIVYIPGAIMAKSNDKIHIRTKTGREYEALIDNVGDLELDITNDYVTELYIKQSVEK